MTENHYYCCEHCNDECYEQDNHTVECDVPNCPDGKEPK